MKSLMKIDGPYPSRRELRCQRIILIMVLLTIAIIIGIRLNYTMKAEALESASVIVADTPKPEIVTQSVYPLTADERDLIERVVAAEARGEPPEGKEAVAQVILDRAVTWGQTITQVCTAPDQFAAPYQGEISAEVKNAVSAVFDQGVRVWEEPTTHLCSGPTVYWESNKVDRGQIGGNRFYN